MKYYMVPVSHIEDLERARKYLLNDVCNDERTFLLQRCFLGVTPSMYRLTHKRYPIVILPKVIKFLVKFKLWKKR